MNGGYWYYLEEQQTVARECPDLYGGKGGKISMVYLKMHVENVYIKCSIEHLKRLEEQRSLSAKIYTRDERLIFRNYVLALFHEMAPSGKITQLQPKIIIPRINQVYEKSKVYRLATVIH